MALAQFGLWYEMMDGRLEIWHTSLTGSKKTQNGQARVALPDHSGWRAIGILGMGTYDDGFLFLFVRYLVLEGWLAYD